MLDAKLPFGLLFGFDISYFCLTNFINLHIMHKRKKELV